VGQQDVFTARQGDAAVSLISLYKALGGGWQLAGNKNFITEATQKEMNTRTDWGKLITEDLPKPSSKDESLGEKRTPDW